MSVRRAADSDLAAIHSLLEQLMPASAHRRLTMWNEAVKHHDEHFRGRGLGERLLGEAIAHCKQGDVAELHVWTGADNTAAIGLYKRAGFAERAVLMELEVRSGSAPRSGEPPVA